MTGGMIAAITLIVFAAIGTQVIAAHEQSDQPAAQTQPLVTLPTDQVVDAPPTLPPTMPPAGPPDLITLLLAMAALALIFFTRCWQLRRAPARPYAFTALSAFMLLAMMYLLWALGASLARAALGISAADAANPQGPPWPDLPKLVAFASVLPLAGAAAYFALLRSAKPPSLDRRASTGRAVAMAVATLLVIWPLVSASVMLAAWITRAPSEPLAHATLKELAHQPIDVWWLVMMAMVVMVAPIIEEVMYRGLLQEGLRRAGASNWPAIALTSIVFAMAHTTLAPNHALVGLFVFSLGLGWSYERTGRLLTPILIHAMFNAGNLLLARVVNA